MIFAFCRYVKMRYLSRSGDFDSIVRLLLISTSLVCIFLVTAKYPARAQDIQRSTGEDKAPSDGNGSGKTDRAKTPFAVQPARLIIAGEEVFVIQAQLGPYTPERRIETIKSITRQLERDPNAVKDISLRETPFSTDIVSGQLTILTITDADAKLAGVENRQALAQSVAHRLQHALEKDLEEHSFSNLLIAAAYTAGATAVLVLCLAAAGWLFPKLYTGVERSRGRLIRTIRIQKTELLSQDTLADVLVGVLRVVRILIVFFLVSIYAPVVLSFFPETRHLSSEIVDYSIQPFRNVVIPAVLSYLPNVAFMAAVIICTYYTVAFTHFAFREISRGNITISGFDPEWSDSTYKIARFLIIAFMFVMIYPYLPGSGSPAFQQVSIFLGILLSLGSTGSVSHIISGVFLTYTGAFKIGDRVKIADTIGDVVEKTLLATRIRTIKHEYITIPNGLVLGSHIINYSSSAGNAGLILHTTITIGYDVPWKIVHQLLIDAAQKTENIQSTPAPFVLQTSLDDFYISYQINAYTDTPSVMAVTYSLLHQNIQDAFNEAGVEIMSPHYQTLRDGNQTTIPSDYLPKDYQQPAFVIARRASNPLSTSDVKS